MFLSDIGYAENKHRRDLGQTSSIQVVLWNCQSIYNFNKWCLFSGLLYLTLSTGQIWVENVLGTRLFFKVCGIANINTD